MRYKCYDCDGTVMTTKEGISYKKLTGAINNAIDTEYSLLEWIMWILRKRHECFSQVERDKFALII